MAFTREFIRKAAKESGVELPKELEDALVQEHISARDAFAKVQVDSALEANKPESPPKVKDTEEYKELKKQFDDYKAEQEGKETKAAKEKAYRALLQEAGVSEKRLESVLKVSDVDRVELDDKGAIKGADKLTESIKSEWADFITTTQTRGAQTSNPPANNNGGAMTKADIYKKDDHGRYVLSAAERQKALMENQIT